MQSSKRTLGEAMSDLLQTVKGLSVQPKCIFVLGARTEAMLNWLLSLTGTRVVLLEPEKALYEKANLLHSAKGKPDNVIIIYGAPAFGSEQKTTAFFASNVPGFSSVLPPNVIKSIRPALEFTEQEVPVIALKPLQKQFEISEGRPCLLISQLNGAEQQCMNNQVLSAFTHVVIQSSLKPIFGESKPVEKLKKELTECGREYLELAESMPPFSNFVAIKKVHAEQALNYFSQRLQHKEIKSSLEGQLGASKNKTDQVTEELRQAKQQLRVASQRSDEERKRLAGELQQTKHQLQTAKQDAEEKQKQLAEELKQAKQQLQAASQRSDEERKRLAEELQQTKHQLDTALQQAEEKQKQLAEELKQAKQQLQAAGQQNEKERNQLSEELQNTKQRLQSISDKIAESEMKIKGLNDELANANKLSEIHLKASETANRLNLSLQADLNNLRTQYMEKLDEAESLTNLVNELYVKLKQAANYYHSLEDVVSATELTGNSRG